jgi:hypothetical protein
LLEWVWKQRHSSKKWQLIQSFYHLGDILQGCKPMLQKCKKKKIGAIDQDPRQKNAKWRAD